MCTDNSVTVTDSKFTRMIAELLYQDTAQPMGAAVTIQMWCTSQHRKLGVQLSLLVA